MQNPEPCKLSTEEMISLYEQGRSLAGIADMAGRTWSTIQHRLSKAGVTLRPPCARRNREPAKMSTEEMVRLYTEGKSLSQIAAIAGRSPTAVNHRLKRYGVKLRPAIPSRTYVPDDSFFDVIDTPEKAYVLGFFTTDGGILAKNNRLYFHLKLGDISHLERIASLIGLPGLARRRKDYAELAWTSAAHVQALAVYGVTPNKAFTLHYPALPDALHRDYIRGLIDGDGFVYRREFGLCGSSLALVSGARNAILEHVSLSGTTLGNVCEKKKNPPYFCWTGYPPQAAVLHWLYKDASIALEKKLSVVKEHWL